MLKKLTPRSLLVAAFALAAFVFAQPALAADITYTTLPQASDSELVIAHKAAVAPSSNTYANITTATTTTVKSGSGILERIIVNTGGSGSTFTVYDNTAGSGTKIGTGTSATQGTLVYGVRFGTGLTIVTASGSAADITVIYR